MNRHFASALAFSSTVAAATLASALMTPSAIAETPTIDTTPFVSTRSRADVQAEVLANRDTLTAAASEWRMMGNEPKVLISGRTRAQATAEYIAAREQVRAMNSEDSGSSYFAQMPRQESTTLFARNQDQR